MTTTQIAWWGLKETERHNRTGEQLTASQIAEQKRHNIATEDLTATDLKERHRHNVVSERVEKGKLGVQRGDLKERTRHNKVSEKQEGKRIKLEDKKVKEQKRHNREQEAIGWGDLSERERHDKMQEYLGDYANLTNRMSVESQAKLNKAMTTLRNLDAEWYTTSLLLKGGTAGQAAAIAKILGKDLTDAVSEYSTWADKQGEHKNADFHTYLKSNYEPEKADWFYEFINKIDALDFVRGVGEFD